VEALQCISRDSDLACYIRLKKRLGEDTTEVRAPTSFRCARTSRAITTRKHDSSEQAYVRTYVRPYVIREGDLAYVHVCGLVSSGATVGLTV